MAGWGIERIEMPEYGILRINLSGVETASAGAAGQDRLCASIRDEGWTSVILDYRECTLNYTVTEFEKTVDSLARRLPQGFRLAYVFNDQSFVAAARASKKLSSSGIEARAFSDERAALEFARQSAPASESP